jgi:hypothetical protein
MTESKVPESIPSEARARQLAAEIVAMAAEMTTLFKEAADMGLRVDFFGDNIEHAGGMPYTELRAEVWSPLS